MSLPYTATALSPLHIGDGRVWTPLDFLIQRESLVLFDLESLIAEQPTRGSAVLATLEAAIAMTDTTHADRDRAGGLRLDQMLSMAEQADTRYHRLRLPAAEAVRGRLAAGGAGGSPEIAKPMTPSTGGGTGYSGGAAAANKTAAPTIRRDLRGGLGSGKPTLSLSAFANLPAGPSTPARIASGTTPGRGTGLPGGVLHRDAASSPAAKSPDMPRTAPVAPTPSLPPERFVHAFIRGGHDEQVYLPGSALRGALRTALLADILSRPNRVVHGWAAGLTQAVISPRWIDAGLGRLMGLLDTPLAGVVGFADTAGLRPADCLAVEMIRTHSPRTGPDGWPVPSAGEGPSSWGRPSPGVADGGPRGLAGAGYANAAGGMAPRGAMAFRGPPMFVEVVRARTQFRGAMTLPTETSSAQRDAAVQMLCRAANAQARRVLEREYQHFRNLGSDFAKVQDFHRELSERLDRADPRTSIVSVGLGAGWHRSTVGLLLADLVGEQLDEPALRQRLGLAPHRLRSRFPKTRRLIMNSFFSPRQPLGWLELRFDS